MNLAAIIARLLLYTGAMMAVGEVAAQWMQGDAISARGAEAVYRRALLAWVLMFVALLMLFVVQFVELELAPSSADVAMLVRQTAWGKGWLTLTISAGLAAAATAARMPLLVRAAAALVVATAMGGLGHAAADHLPMVARTLDATHVVGMGVWIGALVCAPRDTSTEWWSRFSRAATVSAGLVVLTGVGAGFRRMGNASVAELIDSDYARLLVLKTILVLAILALGARHRKQVLASSRPSRGSLRAELVLAALVLLVTAGVTGMAPPGE